jgi:predicted aspartyl protease
MVATDTVGRVLTEATIESLKDLWAVEQGLRPADQVRRVTVSDALVGTGATLLSLPTHFIQQLGLKEQYKKPVRSSIGVSEASVYDAVRLTIQGRIYTIDVMEVPDGTPVLIGQLPLEHLDFVVDLRSWSLIDV